MGVHEFQDSLFLWYGLDPQDLTKLCDGYNAALSICHALAFKKGGLVTERQNELRVRFTDLAGKTFIPTHVHDDPLIFSGRDVQSPKEQPDGSTLPPSKKKPEAT